METNTLLKQFKDECQVIEFKYEYPGYIGYEQYGIITELSESELNEKYKDIIEGYSPYILLDLNYKAARDEYRKNEKSIVGEQPILKTLSVMKMMKWNIFIMN